MRTGEKNLARVLLPVGAVQKAKITLVLLLPPASTPVVQLDMEQGDQGRSLVTLLGLHTGMTDVRGNPDVSPPKEDRLRKS
jgi:hypothetical protein